ncbi:histone deacetylase family protein [Fulvivirga lutea]|uniref:Histone deacetylase n=1 Tax=Fulvivirga lutea TaxID=2810512 RepID=A0A974WDK4_9BACT|nr:histone deacetylase [Fulvivirga lutea]QSE96118.1 histone deacetylase [Fulvivirga lutea]
MIRLAFSDKYIYELPEGHRFPIDKYETVKEQLVYEGTIKESQVVDPGLVDEKWILQVHTEKYWKSLATLTISEKERKKIGLPVTELSVKRARNSVAGTLFAINEALEHGLGINLSGGTHHAYESHGEGFCVLNDLAIGSKYLLNQNLATKVLIVDLDVHQGNGTAHIFRNDESVFTFSMHGKGNYPLKKEQSDLDIEMPHNVTDDEYLAKLQTVLPYLIEKVSPDFILYQSGVDVMEGDRLGKMALTKEGVKLRDSFVLNCAKRNGIPVAVTMGGGYSAKFTNLVEAHCNTVRIGLNLYQ